jgi:hypothetical protein
MSRRTCNASDDLLICTQHADKLKSRPCRGSAQADEGVVAILRVDKRVMVCIYADLYLMLYDMKRRYDTDVPAPVADEAFFPVGGSTTKCLHCIILVPKAIINATPGRLCGPIEGRRDV